MYPNQCNLCKNPATNQCGRCRIAFYCCKQHQRDDWTNHKHLCKPFKTCKNDTIGRFLEAVRPIQRGEIVIKESPLISAPTPLTIPVCLGCYNTLTEETSRPCTKCGWPVCSALCEQHPNHIPECSLTCENGRRVTIRNFNVIHPVYRCIATLRCLYHKKYDTKVWKKLATLESHEDARKNTRLYEEERVHIAELLMRFFRLDFDVVDILQICGVIQINSHEVPLVEPAYMSIFSTASLLQHSCTANCSKSFDSDGRLIITAARDISPGESLTICYTDALWGTWQRRMFLKQTKLFDCACARCLDPTESNTHFSSVKCPNCQSDMTAKNAREWICSTCFKITSTSYVNDVLDRLSGDLEEISKDKTDTFKDFVNTSREYLNENHFLMTEAKLAAVHCLTDVRNLTDDNLDLKLEYCHQLAPLLNRIAYAEVRTLGLLLFEFHAGLVEKARRLGGVQTILIIEAKKYLEEVVKLLRNEPKVLPEGKVYEQAVENLACLERMLQ